MTLKHYKSGSKVCHGSRQANNIALTFDDGPNEPATSQILEILKSYDVKATFFEVAANVEYFPEAAKKVVRDGHIIGNHSYRHSRFLALKRLKTITTELKQAQEVIFRVSGSKPAFFRPPYGFWSPWLLKAAEQLGLSVILWDNMTDDWNPSKSASEIVKAILKKVKPGGIIVLHDGRNLRHSFDRRQLLLALPPILESVRKGGFKLVTVPELISTP